MAADFVLASGSPRRRELLLAAGFRFDVLPADTDEIVDPVESPLVTTVRLACEKALAVCARVGTSTVVLAADTTVVSRGRIYGKPADTAAAATMLRELGGRNHRVLTAWVVAGGGEDAHNVAITGFSASVVRLRDMSEAEARAYAAGGEPLDKAGSYAVQGEGARFVSAVTGPVDNVIGLPVAPVAAALGRMGIRPHGAPDGR